MNTRADELLLRIRELPPERQAEVESFVELLVAQDRRDDALARLKAAQARLDADPLAGMSAEDINGEIEAFRAERGRATGP